MIGNLAARVAIGALFVGHGTQKLFGWFDGPGFEGTQPMTKNLNLHPAKPNALAVGISEAGGGALLALGLATPLAASTLIGTMITAIRKVHLKNGPWVTKGGYEYNLVLIAACAAIAEHGPGPISLDHLLGIEKSGAKWSVAALALGAAVSSAVIAAGAKAAPAAPAPQNGEAPLAESVITPSSSGASGGLAS